MIDSRIVRRAARAKNRVMMTCASAPRPFGLLWLALILGTLVYNGIARPVARRLHAR